MRRPRSLLTPVLLAAAALVAACGDEPSPVALEEGLTVVGLPALAIVETPTPDAVLLATTDAPDAVHRTGTAPVRLSLASQIGGSGGLDVMALLDASGSVGATAFNQEKAFVRAIAANTLPQVPDGRTRMGIIRFATQVDLIHRLTDNQSSSVVQNVAANITWPRGWTNTLGALQASITHFDAHSAGRGKVIVLITDGVPIVNSTPQNVCTLRSALTSRGIGVLIIGVGSGFRRQEVDCLVDDPGTDIVLASSFDPNDLVEALNEASTFVNPQVSGVSLTATVSADFDVVAGPTRSETVLIDGTDPSLPSYDAGTRTLTWSLDPVDRRIRNITLGLAPVGCTSSPALTDIQVSYDDPDTGAPLSAAIPDVSIQVTGCTPPVADASATATTVEWTPAGGGEVTLDASGSSDADGDALTYTWTEGATVLGSTADPVQTLTVDLPLGEHTLTLTVDDGTGSLPSSDEIVVRVLDTTPPTVTAALVPVADKSVKSKKGRFTVEFSCADDCDPDAASTATLNGIPVENGQVVDLRLKSAKSAKDDKSAKGGKSGKSGKSEKPLKIEGPSFELLAVCVDASGNVGTAMATPQFAEKSRKSTKG